MQRAPIEQQKQTTHSNNLGNIKNIKIILDKPLKLNFEGDVNSIMLLVGPNGTGKSLLLKLTWCMNMCAKIYLDQGSKAKTGMQYIFDKSFEENDLTGDITYHWQNGSISFIMQDGEIKTTGYNIPDEIETATTPIYMSKDMRTFDQIKLYLKMRSALKVPPVLDLSATEPFKELTDTYKLYDIFYVELLITKLRNEIKAPEILKDSLKKFDIELDLDTLGYDIVGGVIYSKDKIGTRTNLHTLGAGHQSLINVFMANTILT